MVSTEANVYKLDLLESFVVICLALYRTALELDFELPPSDRLPGDDALLLAVMGLVRMFKLRSRKPEWEHCLIRAVVLLEMGSVKSKHNYDFLLLLSRFYMYMGLGTLAMAKWRQLSIKNLQYLTMSWVMWPRMATIHPQPMVVQIEGEGEVSIDPLDEMCKILDWHAHAGVLNERSIAQLQAKDAWSMQADAITTRNVIERGFARAMLFAEAANVRRLIDPENPEPVSGLMIDLPRSIIDSNDYTVFPNFEAVGPKAMTFEEHLPYLGDIPNERWICNNLRLIQTWDRLHEAEGPSLDTQTLEQLMEKYKHQDDVALELERDIFEISEALRMLIDALQQLTSSNLWHTACSSLLPDALRTIEKKIHYIMIVLPTVQGFAYPSGYYLAEYFGRLQLLQLMHRAIIRISASDAKAVKRMSEEQLSNVERVRCLCKESAQTLMKEAKRYRDAAADRQWAWTSGGTLAAVDDTVVIPMFEIGEKTTTFEQVCQTWQTSWVEAWQGFLDTKAF